MKRRDFITASENEEFSTNCYGTVGWGQAQTLYYDNQYDSEWKLGTYEVEVRIDDFYANETVSETTSFEVVSS